MDLMGAIGTVDSHSAVFSMLRSSNFQPVAAAERYLWALAQHPFPEAQVILDLIKEVKESKALTPQLKETFLLTLATMGRKTADNKVTHPQ